MTINGKEFIERFEQYCPQWLAEKGDPVGLCIGTLDKPIQRVLITLDIRPEVVKEAIDQKIDLLISKHPPIFRPIKRLQTDHLQEKMYTDLLKHDIAVYSAHTNIDIIEDGLNDWFCELLGIKVENYLFKTHEIGFKKLVVYVSIEHVKEVQEALVKVGRSTKSYYEKMNFTSIEQGFFKLIGEVYPIIRETGKSDQVQEAKVEVIFPETIEKEILEAIIEMYPKEPAFELLLVDQPTITFGIGRVGELIETVDLADFVETVKEVFEIDKLRVVRPNCEKQKVKRIAICGGSGEKFYPHAISKKADVYITGDICYHTAHDMQNAGLIAIDPGHYIEALCKEKFIEKFEIWKKENNWDVDFFLSMINTNPFEFK